MIALLFTTISGSFAGQTYVSASGYEYPGQPWETGNYTDIYISDYYGAYVTVNLYQTNIMGDDAFTLTDILYTDSSGSHDLQRYYGASGHWDPIPTSPESITIGTVNGNSHVGVDLEVYGVDTYGFVNY